MADFVIDVMVEVALESVPEGPQEVEALLETAVRATLAHEQQSPPLELSILLTDDEQIQQMNRDFRGFDKPTDVLSFPAGEALPGMEEADPYLGDIAISVPYAARQAAQAGHDLAGELQLLTIHGVLHLLGYDHDEPAAKEAMWQAQTAVLATLNLQHVSPTEA
ncbi:MAG: rRNA maturation RNase YbeY [Anaerolineales bacterium]|nr:rRNA maturation RNase YbeY [Anaerolineales bacterium]